MKTSLGICYFALALSMSSCYDAKEGCLDPASANYDVSADEACLDCCVYPRINTSYIHQIVLAKDPANPLTFKYNTAYPSALDTNHYFRIERSRFFISRLRLVRADGSEIGVRDSIKLESPAGTIISVADNFGIVDRDIFQGSSTGAVLTQGNFTKIRFRVGLEEGLLKTVPSSVPDKHALSIRTDSLLYRPGAGYLSHLLLVKRDTLMTNPALDLSMTESKIIEIPLDKPFVVLPGYNIKLTLKINYLAWFEGIDLKNENPSVIRSKVFANLPNAFSISQISLEKSRF